MVAIVFGNEEVRSVRSIQRESNEIELSSTALLVIRNAEGKTPIQIADSIRMNKSTVWEVVRMLIRRGFLYRENGLLYKCTWEPASTTMFETL